VGLRCAALTGFLALACAAPAAAASGPTILVKFKQPAGASARVAALGDDVVGQTAGKVEVIDPAPGESVEDAVADYRARPDVAYAEPNRARYLLDLTAPDDPDYSNQWALSTIDALGGWSLFPSTFAPATGAPIGIVDTGVDGSHEDLSGRLAASSAVCLGGTCTSGTPTDADGHGTHVAGIAGATTDNALGVAGLAYTSPLIAVRVFHLDSVKGWIAYDSDIADGIAWAAQHGAKVINLSLGGPGDSLTLCNAVELALNAYHAVVVAAAGNSAVATPTYPAACPGAIGVAATDDLDSPALFSNYGKPDVFMSAPGVHILSTYPSALFSASTCPAVGYCYLDGTSMAAPFVSAVAALIESFHPEATPTAVRQMLALSADKVGGVAYGADPYGTCSGCTWEQDYGYGRVNLARALSTPVPPAPAPPPPPPPPTPPGPITSSVDKAAPAVRVYPGSGRHGRMLRLRYKVSDNKGETTERITVYRRARVLRRLIRPLRTTDNSVAYWVLWRASGKGSYRFCVRATDRAGNRSRLACAAIRVR
jgi:thermitase